MCCKNFLKIHKNIGKKMLAKYLFADGCFIKTILLMYNDDTICSFIRQPMKRNFTPSTRVIHMRSSLVFLSQLKFWSAKKQIMNLRIARQKRTFVNYWDHAKILMVFKRWCNCLILCESCCSHNWPALHREKQANNK